MKIYLVTYYESYAGYSIDEETKVFTSKEKAEEYALQINNEYHTIKNLSYNGGSGWYVEELETE